MTTWTTKHALLHDLAKVTRGKVPVNINYCITTDKPRSFPVQEEIEDEFFQNYAGSANFEAPDVASIKEMLSIVKSLEGEEQPSTTNTSENIVVSKSKLNPKAKYFLPDDKKNKRATFQPVIENAKMVPKEKKWERNAAISSILALGNPQVTEEHVKYQSLIPKVETSKGDSRQGPILSSKSMFRRKSKIDTPKPLNNLVTSTKLNDPTKKSYVPSPRAQEYYMKFVEQSELKKVVTEDIWGRAERIMKEIDFKKALEAEARAREEILEAETRQLFKEMAGFNIEEEKNTSEVLSSADDKDLSGFPPSVLLPQHRHFLTGECLVCLTLRKNNPARTFSWFCLPEGHN